MPPKRKSSANSDGSDAEGRHPVMPVIEHEAPKKRGRKSMIDTILQEEARGLPAPVLPQNQWSVSLVQPQNLRPTTNPTKRRKVQPTAPPSLNPKYPSPGTPSVWGTKKEDFYSAFKSLTESFGGVCFANLGTFPVLTWLIEGPRWPEDVVDGESLHMTLVTEFKLKDAHTSTAGPEKKRGGQKRRTKREDPSTVPTALGNAANAIVPNVAHAGIDPGPQSAPQRRRPCLVRSPIYNPNYPTFCECLQPHCSYHCPTARGILSRGCTTYSWPAHEAMSYSGWSLSAEQRTNCDVSVEAGHQWEPIRDHNASAERKTGAQAQDRDPLAPAPALPSRLPPDTTKIHAQVVPELASLLDHMERKSSMLVISTTDASMDSVLPFQLPSEYGCVVLGFFDVESVECWSESHPVTLGIRSGKLSWKIRLRYAPLSDAADSNGNLASPWWLPPPATAVMSDVVALTAPVLEPEKDIVEEGASGSGEAPPLEDARWCIIQALDGNPRRSWWHCSGCGKINQKDMLIHRRCRSCQRNEVPAPPFIIEDVLQDTSTAPYPCNHAPRSMNADDISVKEFPDMTSVYCYKFGDERLPVGAISVEEGACVKHIFTGPYEDLKVQATTLFTQVQEGIELGWQSISKGIAEGLYYSWASPRHGWVDSEIPQCIHQARKLISKLVSNYRDTDPGDEIIPDEMVWEELPVDPRPSTSSNDAEGQDTRVTGNVRIDQIVALAWTASGSRRGTVISAKNGPVFMLCLGANVELELERCLPDPPEPSAVVNTEANLPVSQEAVAPGTVDEGAGRKKSKGGRQRKSKKNPEPEPEPEPGPEINANPKGKRKGKEKAVPPQPPEEKPKPKPKPIAPPHEKLKICMVHGDVLILSGGDYIYTLTRTGMSILLFASSDAQY